MSAINVVPTRSAHQRGDRPRLRAVPESRVAEIRAISSAPSARRRRAAQLAEDPAMRRRPVVRARVREEAAARPAALQVVRRVVLAVVAVAVAGGLGAGAGLLAQPDPYAGPTHVHSVAAGESLWGLADQVNSQRPLEQVVLDIQELNGMDGSDAVLTPGTELVLPGQ
ncbi:LysM peptidoglycan-binding domain-containing protein [Actinomyces sp.]|uniref:LysM peptidoglycan-binding domain-containing protein n=1 Tax=Actinomyces sp. TaxID=29317 RepID=UPI00289EDD30|nr:LysM peptidoglycan-binding domain-containing protein [Actinomyces sp.]